MLESKSKDLIKKLFFKSAECRFEGMKYFVICIASSISIINAGSLIKVVQ